jgi:hypothetical protein
MHLLVFILLITISATADVLVQKSGDFSPATEFQIKRIQAFAEKAPLDTSVMIVLTRTHNAPLSEKRITETVDTLLKYHYTETELLTNKSNLRNQLTQFYKTNSSVLHFAKLEREIVVGKRYRQDYTARVPDPVAALLREPNALLAQSTNRWDGTRVFNPTSRTHPWHESTHLSTSANFDRRVTELPITPFSHVINLPEKAGHLLKMINEARFPAFMKQPPVSLLSKNLIVSNRSMVEFRFIANDENRNPILDFIVESDDYEMLHQIREYRADSGQLQKTLELRKRDSSGFPRQWVRKYATDTGWNEVTYDVLLTDFRSISEPDAWFEFNPPESYAICELASEGTIIHRYPMLEGKRIGPELVEKTKNQNVIHPRELRSKKLLISLLMITTTIAAVGAFLYTTNWKNKNWFLATFSGSVARQGKN